MNCAAKGCVFPETKDGYCWSHRWMIPPAPAPVMALPPESRHRKSNRPKTYRKLRPKQLTNQQRREIALAAIRDGKTDVEAAIAAGLARGTVNNLRRKTERTHHDEVCSQ
jgi:DNA-binding CsgD family transcriptional regulator